MRELLSIVLGLILSEASEYCPQWAERLVRRAARQMPVEGRERWQSRWLRELEERPGKWSKLGLALEFAHSAWTMRERQSKEIHRALFVSRFLLGALRGCVALLAVPIVLMDALALIAPSGGQVIPMLVTWTLGIAMLGVLTFRGGFLDWPWLRSSRSGAALQLMLFFSCTCHLDAQSPPGLQFRRWGLPGRTRDLGSLLGDSPPPAKDGSPAPQAMKVPDWY